MVNCIKKALNWIKKKWKQLLLFLGIGVTICFAVGAPADKSFEQLPNVQKLETKYEVSLSEHGKVEIDCQKVSLQKWDGEVKLDISLPIIGEPEQNNGRLKWKNDKMEVYTYPLNPTEQMTDGGFEIEIVLKEKPDTNVVTLNIETENLDFFYQPELTQEEIDNGAYRPENVVGSYAVYHSNKTNIHSSQAEADKYKVGKAYHIYRPKVCDNDDWCVWGELDINIDLGVLSVVIPQDFIDKAVYPIKHVAGLTFGYTEAGETDFAGNDYIVGAVEASSEVGNGTKISGYLYGSAGTSGNAKANLYNTSGALITNGTTDEVVISEGNSGSWYDMSFVSSPSIVAQTYWIAVWFESTGGNGNWRCDSVEEAEIEYKIVTYGSWPNPLEGTTNSNGWRLSAYVTYISPGGEEIPSVPPIIFE